MIDPRFQMLDEHLTVALNASAAGDEQLVLEHLYHLREVAWGINSDILARRWSLRPQSPQAPPTISRLVKATIDDLLI